MPPLYHIEGNEGIMQSVKSWKIASLGRGLLIFFAAMTGISAAAASLSAQEGSSYGIGGQTGSPTAAQLEGSVPGESKIAGVLVLSLQRAMELGLANNLGLLLSKEGLVSARGRHWQELSRLLPNLTSSASFHRLQESLAITGINFPGVPAVVGPFNFYDARIFLSQRLFDLEAIKRSRAAAYELDAAQFSQSDARQLVVVAAGAAYLEALTGYARVESLKAQVITARAILDRAEAMHRAGVTPGIDELRARVEWLTRSQQLIVAENDAAKQKLNLIRLIGLPVGQEIELQDQPPYRSIPAETPERLLSLALRSRDDYRAAQHLVKAAEASRQAAGAQRLPALLLNADYGVTGLTPSTLRDTYHIVGTLRLPLFEGGRIRGDVLRSEAQVRQRREELSDLASRIEFELRVALLDLEAAARQVEVARETVQLAELALSQAGERFSAGISDNLEVVQAQQSVAAAHEALISSLYRQNLAKLLLAKAAGVAEEGRF